jgi:hypothetical protein
MMQVPYGTSCRPRAQKIAQVGCAGCGGGCKGGDIRFATDGVQISGCLPCAAVMLAGVSDATDVVIRNLEDALKELDHAIGDLQNGNYAEMERHAEKLTKIGNQHTDNPALRAELVSSAAQIRAAAGTKQKGDKLALDVRRSALFNRLEAVRQGKSMTSAYADAALVEAARQAEIKEQADTLPAHYREAFYKQAFDDTGITDAAIWYSKQMEALGKKAKDAVATGWDWIPWYVKAGGAVVVGYGLYRRVRG